MTTAEMIEVIKKVEDSLARITGLLESIIERVEAGIRALNELDIDSLFDACAGCGCSRGTGSDELS